MRKVLLHIITLLGLIAFLVSCEPAQQIEIKEESQSVLERPNTSFVIYSDTYRSNASRRVQVNLPYRITEQELAEIGSYIIGIERQEQGHNRTYIFYYVADQSREMAWATTHFGSDLEVKILGASKEQYDVLSEEAPTGVAIEGEVIGEWMADRGISYRLILHKKENDIHYLTSIHSDGSFGTEEVDVTETPRGIRLQSERGESFNEYFVIEESGALQFWSEREKYYTAPATN